MQRFLRQLVLLGLIVGALSGQTGLRLKNRPVREVREDVQEIQRLAPLHRRSFERFHVLVQFDGATKPEQVAELERRGARFVQYVPDAGYVVSVISGLELAGTGWRASRIEAGGKISPAIKKDTETGAEIQFESLLVAEFYPDVDPRAAREIVNGEGFEVVENPNLLPNHVLMRGPLIGWRN